MNKEQSSEQNWNPDSEERRLRSIYEMAEPKWCQNCSNFSLQKVGERDVNNGQYGFDAMESVTIYECSNCGFKIEM